MNQQNTLTYRKYMDDNKNILVIDLHNRYSVITLITYHGTSNYYDVQLMLKENTIDRWELIENAEHLIFRVNESKIYSAILKKVAILLEEGFFNYYIDRYEYDIACSNRGNELYERERIGVTHD